MQKTPEQLIDELNFFEPKDNPNDDGGHVNSRAEHLLMPPRLQLQQ